MAWASIFNKTEDLLTSTTEMNAKWEQRMCDGAEVESVSRGRTQCGRTRPSQLLPFWERGPEPASHGPQDGSLARLVHVTCYTCRQCAVVARATGLARHSSSPPPTYTPFFRSFLSSSTLGMCRYMRPHSLPLCGPPGIANHASSPQAAAASPGTGQPCVGTVQHW